MTERHLPKVKRLDCSFLSQGTRCAGWLYLPEGVTRPPVVIMGHGFAAQRAFGLPPFAERFAQNGVAAFLFDYRHLGDSQGQPRNLVDPGRQCLDWQAALRFVRSLAEVNGEKVALWGTSLSGGHVIVTAASDPSVRAIVAQMPYVAPNKALFSTGKLLRSILAVTLDAGRYITQRDPYCVPVVGQPDKFALLNTVECLDGYYSMIPDSATWENRIPARSIFKLSFYNPMRLAEKVTCPALLIAAVNDSLIPMGIVAKAASKMINSTFSRLECGHFEPYRGGYFEQIVDMETAFLERNLLTPEIRGTRH